MVLGNEELASSLGPKPAQSGICSASSSMLAQHFATRSRSHPVAEMKRQKRGGEEAQNARSGEEERGNWAEMDSEEGDIIRSHEQLHRCSSSFCFPAQGCAGAPPGSTRCPCSSERVPRGEKGSARAVTSRELGVARETAHSVLEASFWGCCFSPHWFCIPTAPANSIKPQTAEQQPQDTRQHAARRARRAGCTPVLEAPRDTKLSSLIPGELPNIIK